MGRFPLIGDRNDDPLLSSDEKIAQLQRLVAFLLEKNESLRGIIAAQSDTIHSAQAKERAE